jgi:nucleoside-diphosphate-sugar epimerase
MMSGLWSGTAKLAANLRLLEVDAADIEVVEGDMTDQAVVKEAVTGADAVVHTAATFSMKRRDRAAMEQQNEVGTRTVLQTGAEQGCDVLVHVSSTVALNRPGGAGIASPIAPLRRVTGRRLPALIVPAALATAATMPGYLTGWSFLPGAAEGPRTVACANPVDSALTTEELGVNARSADESFRDTVRWLRQAGHISARQAGDAGD